MTLPCAAAAPSPTGLDAIARETAPFARRCGDGDAGSCNALLVRVQRAANGSERDSYAKVLDAGCAKGAVNACAGAIVVGGGARAATLGKLRKLCEATANSHACSLMGDLDALDKDSPPAKLQEQRALMKKSCDAQPGPACFILAQLEMRSPDGAKSEADIFRLLDRACAGGDGSTCFQLGQAYAEQKQPGRARAAYERGCALLWAEACYNLGWMEKAAGHATAYATLAERACRLADATACDDRAAAASAAGDKDANARYCALWGANACYEELVRITHEGGETAEQAERIVDLAFTACRRGHRGAFRTLQHALQDWTRRCGSPEPMQRRDACALAGFAAAQADAIPTGLRDALKLERAKAKEQLKASCTVGAQVSCQAAANLRD